MTDNHPDDYGWQEGERDAAVREIAKREAIIKKAEALQWAYARQAERNAPQSQPAPAPRRSAVPAPPTLGRDWQNYIAREIKRELDSRDRVARKAIAQVVVAEERQREALGERVKALESELAELKGRIDQERGKRLRTVPPDGGAMIA